MADTKTITGFNKVVVERERKLGNRTERYAYTVNHGEALPSDLVDGELERLEAAGAFAEDTKAALIRKARKPMAIIPNASPNGPDASTNRPETPGIPVQAPRQPAATQTPDVNFVDADDLAAEDDGSENTGSKGKGKKADK